MTNQTTQILEEINRTGGNLSMVARTMGLDYHALKQRFVPVSEPMKVPEGEEPEDIRTLGKPGMERYVIAVKKPGQAWPHNAIIADARKKFDAGTHEMFQSKHKDGWVVQYLIPYLVPRPRRTFFSSMIVMR